MHNKAHRSFGKHFPRQPSLPPHRDRIFWRSRAIAPLVYVRPCPDRTPLFDPGIGILYPYGKRKVTQERQHRFPARLFSGPRNDPFECLLLLRFYR